MISIDWATYVITVPKADTTLVAAGPPEIRSYDVYEKLWKELKLIEADEEGMPFPDAQRHSTEVEVGGVTLAHVVEILAPYTVTFEDGSYQVNCIGCNHNVLDRANMNSVALRSSNSAGLVQVAGGADWNASELEQIRHRLGIDGTASEPSAIPSIASSVWRETLADNNGDGTFGGEVATKADIHAAASTSFDPPASGSVIQGTNLSGSYLDVAVRDGTYWEIQEDGTNGLTVEMTFNLPSADHRPGSVLAFGRYIGTPTAAHYIELWFYNYEASSWEQLVEVFFPGGMGSEVELEHEFYEQHVDRANSNEVRVRLVHNVTSYNPGHVLYLDMVKVSGIDVITAADVADAVWDEARADHSTADTFGEALQEVVEPSVKVVAGFAYSPSTTRVDGNVWLERNGQLDASVTSMTATFYSSSGSLLFAMNDLAPDAQGVFRVLSDPSPPGLTSGAQLYVHLSIVTPSGTYTSVRGVQVVG